MPRLKHLSQGLSPSHYHEERNGNISKITTVAVAMFDVRGSSNMYRGRKGKEGELL